MQQEAAMLVLSRKKNESIIIDDQIRIVVVEVRGDKVRLGIEAPREISVHRQEIHDAIVKSLGTAKFAENSAMPDALAGE